MKTTTVRLFKNLRLEIFTSPCVISQMVLLGYIVILDVHKCRQKGHSGQLSYRVIFQRQFHTSKVKSFIFYSNIQGGFLTGSALKSVEDGNIPTKKRKFQFKHHISQWHIFAFTVLVGIFVTLFGRNQSNNYPVTFSPKK